MMATLAFNELILTAKNVQEIQRRELFQSLLSFISNNAVIVAQRLLRGLYKLQDRLLLFLNNLQPIPRICSCRRFIQNNGWRKRYVILATMTDSSIPLEWEEKHLIMSLRRLDIACIDKL